MKGGGWDKGRGEIYHIPIHNHSRDFAVEILEGLKKNQKSISPHLFYDERGSELFEKICEVPEYYLTRTEKNLLKIHAHRILDDIGPEHALMELGSGSSKKAHFLFDAWLHSSATPHYIPVDISFSILENTIPQLLETFPNIWATALNTSYSQAFEVLKPHIVSFPLNIMFLGSNIGNFSIGERGLFFDDIAMVLNSGDTFLFGADLQKDKSILEAAYNDSHGVTAEFNLNLLHRLNRELGSNFNVDKFKHLAFYNEKECRIEMHLESLMEQTIQIHGESVKFAKGETIHTENSYKFNIDDLKEELDKRGLKVVDVITDEKEYFSVWIVSSDK